MMYFWCSFCSEFVYECTGSPARQVHFEEHLPTALDWVLQYGYPGILTGQVRTGMSAREFVPCFCIFCVHDGTKLPEDRLLNLHNQSSLDHLLLHFKFSGHSQCPGYSAGTCSFSEQLDKGKMRDHILAVHYGKNPDEMKHRSSTAKRTAGNELKPVSGTKRGRKVLAAAATYQSDEDEDVKPVRRRRRMRNTIVISDTDHPDGDEDVKPRQLRKNMPETIVISDTDKSDNDYKPPGWSE